MNDAIAEVRTTLLTLVQKVENGDYPDDGVEWGGAKAIITSSKPELTGEGFYPDPQYVVTNPSMHWSSCPR